MDASGSIRTSKEILQAPRPQIRQLINMAAVRVEVLLSRALNYVHHFDLVGWRTITDDEKINCFWACCSDCRRHGNSTLAAARVSN